VAPFTLAGGVFGTEAGGSGVVGGGCISGFGSGTDVLLGGDFFRRLDLPTGRPVA
jgi:hypothetical protein